MMSRRVARKKSSCHCSRHNPRLSTPPMEYIDLTQDVPIAGSNSRNPIFLSETNSPELSDSVIMYVIELICLNIDSQIIDLLNFTNSEDSHSEQNHNEVDDIIHLDGPHYPSQKDVEWFVDESEKAFLTCPVCLENLSNKRKPTSTKCGHIFCAKCIEQAIKATKKCPMCQLTVEWSNCTRLYF